MKKSGILMLATMLLTVLFPPLVVQANQADWHDLGSASKMDPVIDVLKSTSSEITLTFGFPGFSYEEINSQLRLHYDNAMYPMEKGEPEVPILKYNVAIPTCSSLQLELTQSVQEEYTSWLPLYPAPDFNGSSGYPVEVYTKDIDAYNTNSFFPASAVELGDPWQFRSQGIVPLHIAPIQYNPKTNTYRVIKEVTITITPVGSSGPINCVASTFGPILESTIINYDSPINSVGDLPIGVGTPPQVFYSPDPMLDPNTYSGTWYADYLILAGDDFFDNGAPTDELEDYAEYIRDFHGFDVLVVNPEYYSTSSSYLDNYSLISSIYDEIGSRRTVDENPPPGGYDGLIRYLCIVGGRLQIPTTEYGNTGWTQRYSDTYYGIMSDDITPSDYEAPDLLVGRVPSGSLTELARYTEELVLQSHMDAEALWYNLRIAQTDFYESDPSNPYASWMKTCAEQLEALPGTSNILIVDKDTPDVDWTTLSTETVLSAANASAMGNVINQRMVGDGPADLQAPLLLQTSAREKYGLGWASFDIDDYNNIDPDLSYFPKLCLSAAPQALGAVEGTPTHPGYMPVIMGGSDQYTGLAGMVGPVGNVRQWGRNIPRLYTDAVSAFYADPNSTRAGEMALHLWMDMSEPPRIAVQGDPSYSPIASQSATAADLVAKTTTSYVILDDPEFQLVCSNRSYSDVTSSFVVKVYTRLAGTTNWSIAGTSTVNGMVEQEELTLSIPLNQFTFTHDFYDFKAVVDGDDDIVEAFEFNNTVYETKRVATASSGFPHPLTQEPGGHMELADVHPGYPGPELITANMCMNVATGEEIWSVPSRRTYGKCSVADLNFDGTKELISFYGVNLCIYDAQDGHLLGRLNLEEDYHPPVGPADTLDFTKDEDLIICQFLPVDTYPLDDALTNPEHAGLELLVLFYLQLGGSGSHPHYRGSYFQMFSIGDDWSFIPEWNEYPDFDREIIYTLPAVFYPTGENSPRMAYAGHYHGGDRTNYAAVRNLNSGSLQWEAVNPAPNAGWDGVQSLFSRTLSSADQDEDGLEEVYMTFGQSTWELNWTSGPTYSLTHVQGNANTSGTNESTVAIGPVAGVTDDLASVAAMGPVLYTDLSIMDLSTMGDYSAHITTDGFVGQSIIGPYSAGSSQRLITTVAERYPVVDNLGYSNVMTRVPLGGGTYSVVDNWTMPGVIRKHRYGYQIGCGDYNYPTWLEDINGDNILDYVAIVETEPVNFYSPPRETPALRKGVVNVIYGTEIGEAAWPYPRGKEEIGYTRYSPHRPAQTIAVGQHTWWQDIKLDHDVTIPVGAHVTILPNANIVAAEGVVLDVYGELNILGEENAEAYFHTESGFWEGIRFRPGSTGEQRYFIIEDAYTALRLTNPTLLSPIRDFKILNCDRGVYANLSSDIEFERGTIDNMKTSGIELYGDYNIDLVDMYIKKCITGVLNTQTDIRIQDSIIEDCDIGVYLLNSPKVFIEDCWIQGNKQSGVVSDNSQPQFTHTSFNSNDKHGLTLLNASDAILGKSSSTHGNSFYENGEDDYVIGSAELYLYDSSPLLDAQHNDFIDTRLGYLICDESSGSPYHKSSQNYWKGDAKTQIADWFYPQGIVDYSNPDLQINHSDLLPTTQDSTTSLISALQLEEAGRYQEAADLFFAFFTEDSITAAFTPWVRCRQSMGTDTQTLLAEINQYLSVPYLSSTALWNGIRLQNLLGDFAMTIEQLDERLALCSTDIDSSICLLAQLDTYYEMYLSNNGDSGNGKKGATISKNPGELGQIATFRGRKAGRAISKTEEMKADNTGKNELGLYQIGASAFVVPKSLQDYSSKREKLMAVIYGKEAVQTASEILPTRFDLKPSYPNPFNPDITIPFEVPNRANVQIRIYNVLGQTVAKLVDKQLPAGHHRIVWNSQSNGNLSLASGVYFIRMDAPKFTKTQKIVLLK